MTQQERKVSELVKLAEYHAERSERVRKHKLHGVLAGDMQRHAIATHNDKCAYYAMQAVSLGYVW